MRPGSPRRIGSAQRLQLLSLACEPAQAQAAHADDLQLQRDEALRSASLAAMTLMLSAQGLGLASCPMVGFDAQSLAEGFGLQAHELPVMLVALGHAAGAPRPQKARRPLADILAYA